MLNGSIRCSDMQQIAETDTFVTTLMRTFTVWKYKLTTAISRNLCVLVVDFQKI